MTPWDLSLPLSHRQISSYPLRKPESVLGRKFHDYSQASAFGCSSFSPAGFHHYGRIISCLPGALLPDSTIGLSWIRESLLNFNVFVANRVERIQKLTARMSWHYVPTKSRVLTPND